jgi:hypothetical protein
MAGVGGSDSPVLFVVALLSVMGNGGREGGREGGA